MRNWNQCLTTALIIALTFGSMHTACGDELTAYFASDGVSEDEFGVSAAISGNIVIVGAHLDDDNGSKSGSVYLYDITTGQEVFKLLPNDGVARDHFGFSVSISGNIAIVGAYRENTTGSAYIFDVNTGQQLFKLSQSVGSTGFLFGHAVAIDGTTAIIGDHSSSEVAIESGVAYLFDASTGQQLFMLTADDGAISDHFGKSVAITETTAIAGAPRHDANGSNSGAAYLFDTTTGKQLFKLLPNDGSALDHFGSSVGISGSIAIVGSSQKDEVGVDSGVAYLFDINTGQQLFKLLPADGSANSRFGLSVAIHGSIATVGAPFDDDSGVDSGSAYLFDVATGNQLIKMLPIHAASGDQSGMSLAIDEIHILVGAKLNDLNGVDSGTVVVFDRSEICPADLNGDRVIDTADLGGLLGSFGNTTPFADLNGDGVVDTADLGILLSAFGTTCP